MYKHVLVAVDLSDESEFLLKKAVGIAKRNDAQLSIIHVDVNFSDLYTGLLMSICHQCKIESRAKPKKR